MINDLCTQNKTNYSKKLNKTNYLRSNATFFVHMHTNAHNTHMINDLLYCNENIYI